MPVAKTLKQPCLFPRCNPQLRVDVQRGALAVLPTGLWDLERRSMYQEKSEREARET